MHRGEGDGLRAVLGHTVPVVLVDLAHVRQGPGERSTAQDSLEVERDSDARSMAVPLEAETGSGHEQQRKVAGQLRVHLLELGEIQQHGEPPIRSAFAERKRKGVPQQRRQLPYLRTDDNRTVRLVDTMSIAA
jgi:hypothetical protein